MERDHGHRTGAGRSGGLLVERLSRPAAELMARAGLGGRAVLTALRGGANNRVFRVDAGGAKALLKVYFFDPRDRRDRLDGEFSFAAYAWRRGLRCLPRPLACDRERRLGLYEFVEGAPVGRGDVRADDVKQAIAFHRGLNCRRGSRDAGRLSAASEACFSLSKHLECVDRRIRRLEDWAGRSPAQDPAAHDFVRGELHRAWSRTAAEFRWRAAEWRTPLSRVLSRSERCLSPSDFGFHNAIRTADGSLRFLDFEYAGWDDPAKLICDFLLQPQVPVPMQYAAPFTEGVLADIAEPDACRRRIDLLMPLYRIKWCCIMLNEFLPAGRERRRFVGTCRDTRSRKREQLRKARHMLNRRVLDVGQA